MSITDQGLGKARENTPLREAATVAPQSCSTCGGLLATPAEAWLHQYVHGQQYDGWRSPATSIVRLPFALYPAVAQALQAYADAEQGNKL